MLPNSLLQRSQPTTICNSSTEGQSVYSATQQLNHIVWLCNTGQMDPLPVI